MPKGKPLIRCAAKSRQTGEQCGNAPVPFVFEGIGKPLCRFHGGWSPAVLAKADAAFDRYLAAPDVYESHRDRARRIEAKRNADARRARRQMRKLGADPDEIERLLTMKSITAPPPKPTRTPSPEPLTRAPEPEFAGPGGFAYEGFEFDFTDDVFGGGPGSVRRLGW